MSKEKQIKEMERVISAAFTEDYYAGYDPCECTAAKHLYNAGYRKQIEGRWKGAGLGDYMCSECWTAYSGGDEYNFCPNCCAKMKGGESV